MPSSAAFSSQFKLEHPDHLEPDVTAPVNRVHGAPDRGASLNLAAAAARKEKQAADDQRRRFGATAAPSSPRKTDDLVDRIAALHRNPHQPHRQSRETTYSRTFLMTDEQQRIARHCNRLNEHRDNNVSAFHTNCHVVGSNMPFAPKNATNPHELAVFTRKHKRPAPDPAAQRPSMTTLPVPKLVLDTADRILLRSAYEEKAIEERIQSARREIATPRPPPQLNSFFFDHLPKVPTSARRKKQRWY